MHHLDCLCAGIVVADFVCRPIAAIPPQGRLATTDGIEFTIGGCASNVAVDLARLGLSIGVSGRVGDDVFGRELRERLKSSSVNCEGLAISEQSPTSTTVVLNVLGEDRRFVHCIGANYEYDGSQITADDIAGTRVLYVGGYCLFPALSPERVGHLFRVAQKAGVITILDVVLPETGEFLPWVEQVLPFTDYFFPNDDEAAILLSDHQSGPEKLATRFHEMGARHVVVTCGSEGSVLVSSGAKLRSGVYPVTPLDSTGTGDAFVAGFIYGILKNASLESCLKFGTAMGASCVQSVGATTGVFNRSELEIYVDQNSLAIESFD